MVLQRYLLIAAIAVLSFMLMTEWVRFSQKQAAPAAATTTQTAPATPATQAAPAAQNAVDMPDTPPAATATAEIPTAGTAPAAAATQENRYIEVHTDVLSLKIDLQGGDIVYAALRKHAADLDAPNIPFVLLEQNANHTYVAQSGIIGLDTGKERPRYQTTAANYQMGDADALTVELTYQNEQVSAVKRFSFRRSDYLVGVSHEVKNIGAQPWQGYQFGQLKRDHAPDPSVHVGALGISSYLGAATFTPDSPYHKLHFDKFAEEPFKQQIQGGWIAMIQHYFLTAWVPDAQTSNEYSTLISNNLNLVRFKGPAQVVAPGASGQFNASIYIGPKDQYRLRSISTGLDLTVDYGFLWWIAQPLFWFLIKINGVLHNWGWSIMVLTLGVKALFFWLNAKAYTSMANMRRVQPKLLEIRERYADDRQKQSLEMMNLYKTEKINPLGGCLPVLIQMPVFLALYWVLLESVELRHAPWILWIKDLSAMDPYLILPVLMGITMFFQQRLNPPPPDPMQAKVLQWMPLIFTFFFLWFPSGLVLYYVVNNLLSIAQQYVITKRIESKA